MAKRRCSSYRLLDPVLLSLLSQPSLYSTVVCQALRQPLRRSLCEQRGTAPSKSATDFEGVCAPCKMTAYFHDPPPPLRELTSANTDRVKGERDGWYILRPVSSIR